MSNPTSGTWLVEKSFCPETKQPCFDIESKESNHFIGRAYLKDDALLMAAAPELLQSAKCALADLEGILPEFETGGDRLHPGWQTLKELKAVIHKATGEQA
jgi:hypothetical protein